MGAAEIEALVALGVQVLPEVVTIVKDVVTEIGKISPAFDPAGHQSRLSTVLADLEKFAGVFAPK